MAFKLVRLAHIIRNTISLTFKKNIFRPLLKAITFNLLVLKPTFSINST